MACTTIVRHAVSGGAGATTRTGNNGDEGRTTCLNHGADATAPDRKNGSSPAQFFARCKAIVAGKAEKITGDPREIPTRRAPAKKPAPTTKQAATGPTAKNAS